MSAATLAKAPAQAEALPRRAFVAQIMGLPISVHVRGPRARDLPVERAVERAFDELRADDDMFSTWKPDSPVSRIRDGRDSLAEAHPRIRRVASLCELAGQRTGGAFSAWLPDGGGTLRFDPTGLVKGWAVEQAMEGLVERLAALGQHDVLINAGGDVAVHCERTDTPDWSIAVEDPRDRSRVLQRIAMRTGAVATSGTAARGLHITDPWTGAPATDLLSATVIGPGLTWADVYATAAFVLGRSSLGWLATRRNHAGILVDHEGRVTTVRADPRTGRGTVSR
ncbi:FAD:protein FMN transferase [Tessaracoccus sp. G1721]